MALRPVDIRIDVSGNVAVQVSNINKGLSELDRKTIGATKAMGAFKGALGALGLAMGAKEVLDLTKKTVELSMAQKSAKAALSATTGSMEEANRVTREVQEVTGYMVSATEAASGANTLLASGLAKNATEAGKLIKAGGILTQVFKTQGASQEKFIRLMSSGNKALLDNFNLTSEQVKALQKQIEATEGLSAEEAKLEAIKRLLIESSETYASTLDETTVAAAEYEAAMADLGATMGDMFTPAVTEGAKVLTGLARSLIDAREAIEAENKSLVKNSSTWESYQKNLTKALRQGKLTAQTIRGLTKEEFEQIKVTEKAEAATASFAGAVKQSAKFMTEQQFAAGDSTLAIDALGDAVEEADQEFKGSIFYGGVPSTTLVPTSFYDELKLGRITAEREANEAVAEAYQEHLEDRRAQHEQAMNNLRSDVESLLVPTEVKSWELVLGGPDHWDEHARRLAAIAEGGLSSEWTHLVPAEVLAQGEEAVKAWAAKSREDFFSFMNPEMVNIGALVEAYKQKVQSETNKAQVVQAVVEQLAAEGIEVTAEDVGLQLDFTDPIERDKIAVQEFGATVDNVSATNIANFQASVVNASEMSVQQVNLITSAMGSLGSKVDSVGAKFKELGDGASDHLGDIEDAGKDVVKVLKEIKSAAEAAGEAIDDMPEPKGGGGEPQAAAGMPYVPRDMSVFVHKGEAIVPASRAGNTYNLTYAPSYNQASVSPSDVWGAFETMRIMLGA